MQFDLAACITNPIMLMFISVFTGILLGKLKIGRFSFGVSGTLFTGLIIGWLVYENFALPYEGVEDAPHYAAGIINNGVVDKQFFYLFLILFVASVGLLAAKDIGIVIKKYGVRFIVLGFFITFAGAAATYLMAVISSRQNPFAVLGVYAGALTSSPGLGVAIETVSKYGEGAEAAVGAGYAIGYPFGVLIVILTINFLPVIFKIDVQKEKEIFSTEMAEARKLTRDREVPEVSFDLAGFAAAVFVGYILGKIKIYMGPLEYFSLGSTGGVLISSLILGHIGRIANLNFRMDSRILGVVRQVSVAFFLAIVGLRYGFKAFDSLLRGGAYLAFVSLVIGNVAVAVGYIIGRYVFKINWIMLSGAICGGMTSTPGLGTAIDAVGSDNPAAGYGAVYPFALLGMVVFTILIHKLPIPS